MAETAITETEFLQSHLTNFDNGVNRENTINFRIEPIRSEDNQQGYIIKSCTVSVSPKQGTLTDQQVNTLIRQAERIILYKTSEDSSGPLFSQGSIQLDIIPELKDFKRNNKEGGSDFFYFPLREVVLDKNLLRTKIEDTQNHIDTSADEIQDVYRDVSILFEPFTTNINFSFSEFNATISNATDSRTSSRIVESDRNTGKILPSNFDAIINGLANPAQVQDSLYSLTGWSTSRYRGTKTSKETYNNLSPTLNGNSFKGEVYSTDSLDSAICNIEYDGRVIEDLLFSGETGSLPNTESTSDENNLIVKFVGSTSKIEAAANAKVWIQETNSIATTNGFGEVISVEQCNNL